MREVNDDNSAGRAYMAKIQKEEQESQERYAAKKQEMAEAWAETIRLKEELIRWPFTRDIVKGAVKYFGEHYRPLLPYTFRDDEYDQVIVAEDHGGGYIFRDSDDTYRIPEAGTWREWAEWEGADLEEFAALHGIEDDQWDDPLGDGVIEENLDPDATPQARACFMFQDVFYPPATVELPIGVLGMCFEDATYAVVEPKVALTFLQILLDYEESGIRIVLEDDWRREQIESKKGEGA